VTASPSTEVLRTLPLLESLTDQQLAELAALGTPRASVRGEVLVRQGEHADHVYLVLAGTAAVSVDGSAVRPPATVGDCVGELAILDEGPRAATVVADGPLEVLTFPAAGFRSALEAIPPLREALTRALGRRLRTVSTGWAELAADADVLLDAYLGLQGSGDPADRRAAVQGAAALLRRLAANEAATPPVPGLEQLTAAERRVADLVARGMSNAAVAAELFLSEHTVASHLKHTYVKLELSSRVALATAVLRAG